MNYLIVIIIFMAYFHSFASGTFKSNYGSYSCPVCNPNHPLRIGQTNCGVDK